MDGELETQQQEIQRLKQEVEAIKRHDHSVFIGIIQGVPLSLLVWYVVVPIVQWLTHIVVPFKFVVIAVNFLTPLGMCGALAESASSTRKGMSRLITYGICEAALIVWYIVMFPASLFNAP